MYRAMGQELPRTKRILELNPEHALVTGLRTAHEANADDRRWPRPPSCSTAWRCSPRAASSPTRPAARLLADRLARSL
jgi:molecular chaperone HtpG